MPFVEGVDSGTDGEEETVSQISLSSGLHFPRISEFCPLCFHFQCIWEHFFLLFVLFCFLEVEKDVVYFPSLAVIKMKD